MGRRAVRSAARCIARRVGAAVAALLLLAALAPAAAAQGFAPHVSQIAAALAADRAAAARAAAAPSPAAPAPAPAVAPAPPRPQPPEVVVAARVVRAGEVIEPGDLTLARLDAPDALPALSAALGREAATTLYPGRPLHRSDLAPPAAVERNQIVTLRFRRGPLFIETDGRALARAPVGVRIPVMNIAARATVIGRVVDAETVEVAR